MAAAATVRQKKREFGFGQELQPFPPPPMDGRRRVACIDWWAH